MVGASFDAKDLFHGSEIDGISREGVERVCGHSYDSTTIQPSCGIANDSWIGIRGTHLQYLSRQSKVPILFWSGGQERNSLLKAKLSYVCARCNDGTRSSWVASGE